MHALSVIHVQNRIAKKFRMKHILVLLIISISFSAFSQSKISYKQHLKVAEELYLKSLYTDAAEHFEAAFRKKTKKKDAIAKAAECYYITRDYKKAASAYRHIKDERKKFPLAGLRYARSLKQSEKFDEASREFVYFINNYNGEDKATVNEVVQAEIRGCEEAIKMTSKPYNNQVEIYHLSDRVNSTETEFAPIPFTKDVLYYSSTMAEKARIYFTMRDAEGIWKKATLPKNFPPMPDQHFCNGSLSPDGQRFYFTICESKENWGGLTTRCEINVISKLGNSWTAPERLHDYVNKPGSTATHPFVVHENDKEILYFSSNRDGGMGGMDLWYASRDLSGHSIDFTFPVNLGNKINTLGDEITPFYDIENGDMYFSSNGQPSMGGQDIFIATGQLSIWSEIRNLGLPYNSSSDDYYYVKTPNEARGFLASNRVFGVEKITTTHEDIFEFVVKENQLLADSDIPSIRNEIPSQPKTVESKIAPTVKNEIVDATDDMTSTVKTEVSTQETVPEKWTEVVEEVVKPSAPIVDEVVETVVSKEEEIEPSVNTEEERTSVILLGKISDGDNATLQNVTLSLYEIVGSGDKRLIENKSFEDGNYRFTLVPDRKYAIEAKKDGFHQNEVQLHTKYGKYLTEDITIERNNSIVMEEEKVTTEFENARVNTSPSSVESTSSVETQTISTYTETTSTAPITSEVTTSEVIATAPITYQEDAQEANETLYVNTEVVAANTSSNLNKYNGSTYVARGASKRDNLEYSSRSPRHQGTYYKIQLIADKEFSPSEEKFANLQYLGRYDTEYLSEKGLYRVLLADFFSLNEAKDALKIVKKNRFKRAFVVKYVDGQRLGMTYR